jgi:hypothetical protein
MAYVKLDTDILTSSLWVDRGQRDVFLTALLMALPHRLNEPAQAIQTRSTEPSGYMVPAGDYGLVRAAGIGIIRMALIGEEEGLAALEALASPDPHSRSTAHDGRRLVRINGGFLVLNFAAYRDRDHSAAERMRRYRERIAERNATRNGRPELRNVAQAEAEAVKTTTLAPSANATTAPDHNVDVSVNSDSSPCANRPESLTLANDETDIPHIVARLQLVDGTEYGITDAQVAEWRAAYPAVDVLAELARMRVWIGAHAARRKTRRGIVKFAVAWLSRAQDAPRPQLAPRAEQAQPPAKWD